MRERKVLTMPAKRAPAAVVLPEAGPDVSEFLSFVPVDVDEERKTAIVDVISKRSSERLGQIKWYGPWRQYAFHPAPGCLFNGRCLADIYDVLGRMMRKRKEMNRAAPKGQSATVNHG